MGPVIIGLIQGMLTTLAVTVFWNLNGYQTLFVSALSSWVWVEIQGIKARLNFEQEHRKDI
jgi:hypothetical protein